MFLWFLATAVLTVVYVFTDPRFDYRLLMVGAVLPDLIDVWLPGVMPLHSLVTAVGLLVVVMLATAGRKPARRLLLGLPIGLMLHLVFDGAWNDTARFLWPLGGALGDAQTPVEERSLGVNLALEAAGAVLCAVIVARYALHEASARRRLLADGSLTERR